MFWANRIRIHMEYERNTLTFPLIQIRCDHYDHTHTHIQLFKMGMPLRVSSCHSDQRQSSLPSKTIKIKANYYLYGSWSTYITFRALWISFRQINFEFVFDKPEKQTINLKHETNKKKTTWVHLVKSSKILLLFFYSLSLSLSGPMTYELLMRLDMCILCNGSSSIPHGSGIANT